MVNREQRPAEGQPDADPSIDRSVDEVAELHHGEWILLQVTERDEHDHPARGIVVQTGPTRRSIQPVALEKLKESKQSGAEYYIFTGYRRLRTGDEWAEALDELVRRGARRGPER